MCVGSSVALVAIVEIRHSLLSLCRTSITRDIACQMLIETLLIM
jgi:hypothetical protein